MSDFVRSNSIRGKNCMPTSFDVTIEQVDKKEVARTESQTTLSVPSKIKKHQFLTVDKPPIMRKI